MAIDILSSLLCYKEFRIIYYYQFKTTFDLKFFSLYLKQV
jgi:hypothetical protein